MTEPTYVRAKVSGDGLVRDVLTRESIAPGGEVTLLVREPGQPLPRCPRHPQNAAAHPGEDCLCHGTLIDGLVEQGLISDVKPYHRSKARAAAADKKD